MYFQALKRNIQISAVRYLSSTTINNGTKQQFKMVNLTIDEKTGIATLELNRPPVNTLNTALLQDISSALTEVEQNQSKGMILTSVRIACHFIEIINSINTCMSFSSFSHRHRCFRLA